MFRIMLATVITILLCACAAERGNQDKEIIAEAGQSSKEAQLAYLQCRYMPATGSCRQAVWRRYPHPDLGGDLSREGTLQYIGAMEMLGAGEVLHRQGQQCDAVTNLDTLLFKDGLEITCSDGNRYQLDRSGDNWAMAELVTPHD